MYAHTYMHMDNGTESLQRVSVRDRVRVRIRVRVSVLGLV